MSRKSKTVTVDATQAIAAALLAASAPVNIKAPAATPIDDKAAKKAAADAARIAERAKRFPAAAKAESEAKAASKGKAGKSVRAATPKAPKVVAEKPAKPTQPAFVPKIAKAGQHVYAVSDVNNARPVAGRRLFAHTHAALTMMGLLDPKIGRAPRKIVLSVMGQRAVAYHTAERNFEDGPDGTIQLTTGGRNKFMERHASGTLDTALANEFMDLFLTGKVGKTAIDASQVFQIV